MKSHTFASADRPAIHLGASEGDALFNVALSAEARHPLAAAMLMAELDRAVLHDADDLPEQTVVMNAYIDFVDEGTGTRRTVQLVYPHEADISVGRVSILSPVGAALIGMTAGHSIFWPDRAGHGRMLHIVNVKQPAKV